MSESKWFRPVWLGLLVVILLGYGSFREHHEKTHALLDRLGIRHGYRDGPRRKHDWHSGWLPEAVELFMKSE